MTARPSVTFLPLACPDPGIQNNLIYEWRRVTEIAVPRSDMALVSAPDSQASNAGLALEDYSIYSQLSDDQLLALAIERSLTNDSPPCLPGNQHQPPGNQSRPDDQTRPGNQRSAPGGETSRGHSSRRTGQPNGPHPPSGANPPRNQPPGGAATHYSSHNPPVEKLLDPWVLHGLPLKDTPKLFYAFTLHAHSK